MRFNPILTNRSTTSRRRPSWWLHVPTKLTESHKCNFKTFKQGSSDLKLQDEDCVQPNSEIDNVGIDVEINEKSESSDEKCNPVSSLHANASFLKRFVGNTFLVRIVRAGNQSVISIRNRNDFLSPWGDNNPFTLPNVRIRDVVLVVICAAGSHYLIAMVPAMSLSHSVISVMAYPADMLVEQTLDETVAFLPPFKDTQPRVLEDFDGLDVLFKLQHAFLGVKADLNFVGNQETQDRSDCSKGWFCPYLYASGRTPLIARDRDFEIAELIGPGLPADSSIAPTLLEELRSLEVPMFSLCPDTGLPCQYPRVAVFVLGISSPRFRAWSQARQPNRGVLTVHLSRFIPAVVVPVKTTTPICAWSPWTTRQMMQGMPGYNPVTHWRELVLYIENLLDPENIREGLTDDESWRAYLRNGMELIVRALLHQRDYLGRHGMEKVCRMKRAGIVMFRF